MSDSNEQETRQEEDVQETVSQPAVELPGRRLREKRESSHLSLDEVAHHLRLDVQLIKALENDEYSDMMSPAYICGYLRSYARLLKLPEDEVVQAYSHGEQINAALIPSSVSIQPRKTLNLAWIKPIFIILVVILIAGGLYLLSEKYDFFNPGLSKQSSNIAVPIQPVTSEDKTESSANAGENSATTDGKNNTTAPVQPKVDKPVQAKVSKTVIENLPTPKTKIPENESIASTQQTNSKPAKNAVAKNNESQNAATASTENAKQIKLHFDDDSWAEVSDSTGKKLVYRLVNGNTDLTLDGVPPFTILLGNAPVVKVFYDGKEFDHSRYHRDEIAYFKIGKK